MFKEVQDRLANYADTDRADDMRDTAHRLLGRQFFYRYDHQMAHHYERVIRHQDHFRGVLHLLGMRLIVNQTEEVVGCVHDLASVRPFVRTPDIILLLVLRHLYEERAKSIHLTERREAQVTSLEIDTVMKNMTGQPLASRRDQFRAIMAPFKERGLVKLGDDTVEGDAIGVEIRSAIKFVVDNNYLSILKTYLKSVEEVPDVSFSADDDAGEGEPIEEGEDA